MWVKERKEEKVKETEKEKEMKTEKGKVQSRRLSTISSEHRHMR